jgi:hypothetical protein
MEKSKNSGVIRHCLYATSALLLVATNAQAQITFNVHATPLSGTFRSGNVLDGALTIGTWQITGFSSTGFGAISPAIPATTTSASGLGVGLEISAANNPDLDIFNLTFTTNLTNSGYIVDNIVIGKNNVGTARNYGPISTVDIADTITFSGFSGNATVNNPVVPGVANRNLINADGSLLASGSSISYLPGDRTGAAPGDWSYANTLWTVSVPGNNVQVAADFKRNVNIEGIGFLPNISTVTGGGGAIPEPGTMTFLGLGIFGFAARRYRK